MLCSSLQTCHCCFETSDPPAASCGNATTRRYLAAWTLAIGAGEFLLNPTVGKLSDAIGRKPFMLLSVTADNLLSTARKKKPYPLNALERELVGYSTSVLSRQHCHLQFHAKLLTPPPPPPPPPCTWSILMGWCALNKISYNEHCNESCGRTQPFHLDAFGRKGTLYCTPCTTTGIVCHGMH